MHETAVHNVSKKPKTIFSRRRFGLNALFVVRGTGKFKARIPKVPGSQPFSGKSRSPY